MTPASPARSEGSTDDRVPDAAHYEPSYLGTECERLNSYREQVQGVMAHSPKHVLVVGVGDGIVVDILRNAGIRVTTLDIQSALKPDIVSSITEVPCPDSTFDGTVCCQVLEHLPYDQFTPSLRQLYRVSRHFTILSLPDIRRFMSLRVQAQRLSLSVQWSPPRLRPRTIPRAKLEAHGHHWEIGYRDTPFAIVNRDIRASGWRMQSVHRVYDLPWHTFFTLTRTEVVS